MQQNLCVFAPAKINLFLHITGRRSDGYHTLQSLIGFADIGDVINIEPAQHFTFSIEGPFAGPLEREDADYENNLVVKAAQGLANIVDKPLNIHIRLTKNLPIAAGLGGGSSDAAASIWGLQKYWGLSRDTPYLWPLLTRLGADVPVCLRAQPQIMEGIGEALKPAPLMPDIPILLVNPSQSCSTHEVFLRSSSKVYKDNIKAPAGFSTVFEIIHFLQKCDNDLFDSAVSLLPEIRNVMSALEMQKDCLFARMSGSGASCFGLFETMNEAKKAAKIIAKDNPEWWVKTAWLNRPERY
jgi:4-diphosphocytidyl-2-C-methyl-D-erythritol kinase